VGKPGNRNGLRREFIKNSIKITALACFADATILGGCNEKDEDQKVSPPEDLMQEHGLLNRILLIYDTCRMHLGNKEDFPKNAIADAAGIIRTFVENYHEKQEENYLFPRFQKANQLTGLVTVLLQQHKAGRVLIDQIMQLAQSEKRTDMENQKLIQLLASFNRMYRPHEARRHDIISCFQENSFAP